MVTSIMLLAAALFLAAQPGTYTRGLISLFPRSKRDRSAQVLDESLGILRSWVLAKVIEMALVGAFVGFGLRFLGVPLAFFLGVIAGLLDFIPNIGGIISFVPAALLAMFKEPSALVSVALVYVASHSIDNCVLLPWLQLRLARVPPGLALGAQLLLESARRADGELADTANHVPFTPEYPADLSAVLPHSLDLAAHVDGDRLGDPSIGWKSRQQALDLTRRQFRVGVVFHPDESPSAVRTARSEAASGYRLPDPDHPPVAQELSGVASSNTLDSSPVRLIQAASVRLGRGNLLP